jgi:tetratricopeptide (TPR) repeat protein
MTHALARSIRWSVVGSAALALLACKGPGPAPAVAVTVGDVYAIHADVTVSARDVLGEGRLSDGDTLRTGPDGRARVRLDDGTLVAVAQETTFTLRGQRLELGAGRVYVLGNSMARTEVALGSVSTTVSSSAAAFEASAASTRVYCAQGELLLRHPRGQARVMSGETATIAGDVPRVAPEKAFDDWTGGLAVPWASALGEKTTLPEVRSSSGPLDAGQALVIRSHTTAVQIQDEVAVTRTRTRFFNGSSSAAHARARLTLPAGAILERVVRYGNEAATATEAQIGIAAGGSRQNPGASTGLEWAGGGWVAGELGPVAAGETLDLELEYVEWLSTRGDRAAYRFAMAGGEASLVGELGVDLHAEGSRWLSVSAGSSVSEGSVHLRQSDVRPVGDVVVELAPDWAEPGVARAYVAAGERGEDAYVMVRTEVPERREPGVTLAVVLDTSQSVGEGTLETERAVLDAVLGGLGPRDSLVVLAADQSVRELGAATPEPVTPALRGRVQRALDDVRAGGASNIGLALERAADILDAPSRGERAGEGMVVYIGDGRPTLGEPDALHIRRALARRGGGIPRLGAVAVGSTADRWALARLVAGGGSLYEVGHRSDAARAGAALLAEALQPTLRDVQLDLGPNIDRVYPRDARAISSGSTVTVIGRLRGKLPASVGFRFRDGSRLIDERRALTKRPLPRRADVARRWAAARVDELAARDEGIEPAIAIAARAGLLTPWTSWFFEPPLDGGTSQPLAERVLELSSARDTPFGARIDSLGLTGSTLLEPPRRETAQASLAQAAQAAVRRILSRATAQVRACRDARAAVRPDLGRTFSIALSVDVAGRASRVQVVQSGSAGRDRVLERCIQGVVQSLPYVAAGVAVRLEQTLEVPDARASSRTRCSEASKVALPLRKSIWRARGQLGADGYETAARACELPRWTDQRAYLLLAIEERTYGIRRLELARELEREGQADAARFVRRETLRHVRSFEELSDLSRRLIGDEPNVDAELDRAYDKATSDGARLAIVRRFIQLAPHNHRARRRLLSLLEASGSLAALVAELDALRAEPFIDASLLAQGASALRRMGRADEGRRIFGELCERAPADPWTLAYVGDRLRAEGLFDEASAAYDSLARLLPGDAAVTLRLALGHAGAGRLDIATRLLERVTQTGGRGEDGKLGELSSITQAVLLAGAQGSPNSDIEADIEAELARRLAATPLPDVQSVVLVQSPPIDDPIVVSLRRERGEKQSQSSDLDARGLGLVALRIERGDGIARIRLERPREPGPGRPTRATVFALVLDTDRTRPRLLRRDIDVSADGKPVELRFDGEAFL